MILIDTTVLSNFVLARVPLLLKEFCGSQGGITQQVLAEFERGVQQEVLPATALHWLTTVRLQHARDHALFSRLQACLGAGEASCLALTLSQRQSFLSDDMKARRMARSLGVPVSGSVGVLVALIRARRLTCAEGNQVLRRFIAAGYFSPVQRLDDLLPVALPGCAMIHV
ncbi:MAG: DUF3368 domain-containing protein [Candidatus Tectimicrobiota bacterium]